MILSDFYFDYYWRAGCYFHVSTIAVIACIRNYLRVNFECEIYIPIARD